ncbi:hypothetical protein T440DRAFT_421455 [Plenodomus tracheiphilus IPT5]|uniref:Uncharacterized protein n=1 Tax=Plenodomus tracheiphilus IPT5 TaxID=1408161 RepID=A0A6A7BCI7_9PLEO|nr:hypothetical protein T440DRAFT_421455 [Plenodomus tracheiphilus IPT5]
MHDFSMQSLPWINRVNLRYPLHLDSRVSDKIETWFSTIASTTSSEDKWTLPPSVKAMNDSRANLQDTSMETLPHSTTHTEASMDDEDYFAESSKEMSHDGTEMSNGTLDEFSGDQYLESNTESVHSLTASGDDVDWEPSEERPEIETMSLPNMAGDHDRKMTSDENDLIVNWPTNPASGTAPEGSQQWDNVSRHPGHYSPRATMANMTLLPTMVPEIMYPVASAGSALYKTTSQRGSSSDERDSFEQAWKKHTESGVTATEPIDVAAERGHAIHDAGASLRHEAQPEQGDKYSVPDESNRPDSPFGSKPGLSYIFRVDEICEAPDATATIDNKGDWVPSILTSDNIAAGGGVSGTWWYCNGSQIYSFPPAQAPTEAQRYKTYSAYYSGGRGFWILDSDALRPRRSSTWQPLRFAHDTSDYSSYLTTAAETGTLACQRADQTWPNMLLPNIYHGSDTPYAQYGSLKGELGIFLALMSLSVKQDFMAQWFPMMFNNSQWYTHVLPHGRQDKRGVVVYIYTCPPSWNAGSTKEILQAYEDGNWFGSRYYH